MKYVIEKQGKYAITEEEEDANYALVPINEYNGLLNAVRIVRDRAKQAVKKSQTDEHGYKLLRADRKPFDRDTGDAWLITKQTPYSVDLSPSEVLFMLKADLWEFYGYSEEVYEHDGFRYFIPPKDYIRASEDYVLRSERPFLAENSEKGELLKEIFERNQGNVSFFIARVGANYGAGVYEVSYWATNVF